MSFDAMNEDRYINVKKKTFQEMRFLFHSFDFQILRENSFKHPLVNNHVRLAHRKPITSGYVEA